MSSPTTFHAGGVPVDYSFYSDQEPNIRNGTFEVTNQAADSLHFAVHRIWCRAGGQELPLAQFFVYRQPNFEEEDPVAIQQPPQSTVQYEVTFAPISAAPYLQEEIEVGIELLVEGETTTVFSPYHITRRTKRAR